MPRNIEMQNPEQIIKFISKYKCWDNKYVWKIIPDWYKSEEKNCFW